MGEKVKENFLRWVSLFFGSWLFYVGIMKWVKGPFGFVGWIVHQFQGTWVPHPLLVVLAWTIMVAEPLCAILLLLRKNLQTAWCLTALLMFMLTFGQTVLGNYETVANNWQYTILALLCASLAEKERR